MDDQRPDPQKMPGALHEQHESKKGRLKIFFGYAAGVGKTYAMLEAAHQAKSSGIDVVAGYVEHHIDVYKRQAIYILLLLAGYCYL